MRAALANEAARLGVAAAYVDGTGVERTPPTSTVEAIVEILSTRPTVEKSRRHGTNFLQSSDVETGTRCALGPQPARTWGVFAPLAGLDAGDLSTLRALADAVTPLGAGVIATLPLLARRPDEASPYSPVTRRFWDDRWSAPTRKKGGAALTAWRAANPEVEVWARWRAATDAAGWDPRQWDGALDAAVRSGDGAALGAHGVDAASIDEHARRQWVVSSQLHALAADLRARGAALYLDLPVGTTATGFDVWESPEEFAVGMSIGAPPDRFFPDGQSWGLVPPLPGRGDLERALDAHMSVCGLLRIDHVMGLHRLFWVPDGGDPADGTYVAYPAKENWRIVVEASRRHDCGVVGEDLGTVPQETRDAMAAVGARGLFIAQDEIREPFRLRRPVPAGSVASLNTHDLPPLAAWHATSGLDAPPATVRDHLLGELAMSDADVVLVSEQDLVLDDRRINVPGEVGGELWTLPSRSTVEDVASDAESILGSVDRWRRTERGAWPKGEPRLIDDADLASLHAGTHACLADRLGLHPRTSLGVVGCAAGVWAPHATEVVIAGDFDGWSGSTLARRGESGVWDGFVPAAMLGDRYKVHVRGPSGSWTHKSDPFCRAAELPPGSASIVTADDPAEHEWGDAAWMAGRAARHAPGEPMSIYELHLGSWRRHPDGRVPTYADVTPWLIEYVLEMGFTHVELMPVMEHPFGGSWGYHVTGYFAPTTRYGTPAEFALMVDALHGAGIGVILDWVPAHFPDDEHGLADFDGAPLFEYADPREGRHPEWGSRVFDWGRPEVRAFLVSSARWWIERYHVDGLRVDAVASMLYRDYGRSEGEWRPNRDGGRENLEAIDFVRQLTTEIGQSTPGALLIAEESTAWPGVTHPTNEGGLGFDLKWDLGWMHDMLEYLGRDPVHRSWHQDDLTFRAMYAGSERFVLPLSHDEVVHGKSSLVGKMAGDEWQRRANLRVLFGHQFTTGGVPLLFMGGELAMNEEWDHESSLPWHLLEHPEHRGVQRWVGELNRLLRSLRALAGGGFEWIACDDRSNSIVSWVRRGPEWRDDVVVIVNFTPAPHEGYRLGLPHAGRWSVVANSDDARWGGSAFPTPGAHDTEPVPCGAWQQSALVTLPPLALTVLTPDGAGS